MKIGSKLLLLRHQYSFSQEYVADKLNISQSTYSRIESDIFPPKSRILQLLSELYQIPISYFLPNHNDDSGQGWKDLVEAKDRLIKYQVTQIFLLQSEINQLRRGTQ